MNLLCGVLLCGSLSLVGQASAQTRSLGLDISAWQGNISQTTWNNFYNVEDREFVFLRSSRGGTTGYYNQSDSDNSDGLNTFSQRYDDPYFIQNITRATAAGMFAGSYHFARPDIVASTFNAGGIANSGTDEANHMLQMAGPWMRPGYLLPVLDLEAGQAERTQNELAQFSIDFSDRIHEVMGIRPAVYMNGNYANDLQEASTALRNEVVAVLPTLWSARWPNQGDPDSIPVQTMHPKDTHTPIYGPWDDAGTTHPWTFWQYASTGRLNSFNSGNSNLDFNVAQGGIEFVKDQLVPALWMDDTSGDWSTLDNWNSGQTPVAPVQGPGQVARVGSLTLPVVRLPALHDTVILDRPGNITVTLSSGTHNIRKLYAREALNITGGSLGIGYLPSTATEFSAQFSANASLAGSASLSAHTLQVDATKTLTLNGGTLTFNKINLMPHLTTPATIVVGGDVALNPLSNAAAVIANGAGSGSAGFIDLGGENRRFTIGDGSAATDLTISVPLTNGSLAKAGPGTLHLTANSVYQGETAVEEGTLRINVPFLDNTAGVHLTSGATLNLNFGGTPDFIDSLLIDGEAQAGGIWGALSSGAQFTTPWITGTGFLQVKSPGDFNGDGFVDDTDLAQWQGDYGVAGGGDADGDGDTDGRDFLIWQRNYTGSAPLTAEVTAIPEPATWVLLLTLTLTAGTRRR